MSEAALPVVGADTKVRLDIAAKIAFPDGSIGLSSLRREARKGRLKIWRVANKDMTSLAEIERMLDRCLVQSGLPDYGCDPLRMDEPPLGSSSTTDASTALAAARMRVERLKGSSSSTSPSSTTARRAPSGDRNGRQ